MASYFAVGLPFTFDGTTNHFATTTGGTATLSNPTTADTVTFDGLSGTGTCTFTADMSCATFVTSSANVTLAPGSHTITCAGTSNAWNMTAGTFTPGTSTIKLTDTSATGKSFIGTQKTYGTVILNVGSTTTGMTGSNSFTNLTIIGAANKTGIFQTSTSTQTISGTFTVTGNSATNRVFVQSGTFGTTKTFSAAAVSLTNVDFIDIAGTGGAAPFTGTSLGDSGGNSGITFDTPVDQTWSGNTTGNWSTTANWTTRVPLSQDNVFINALTSGVITADMPRMGATIDFTGSTGGTLTLGLAPLIFGGLIFAPGMSFGGAFIVGFEGRNGSFTLTSAGLTYPLGVSIAGPGSTFTLGDNLNLNSARTLSHAAGTLDLNGKTASAGIYGTAGTLTRALTDSAGGGTLNCTGTGTVFVTPASGLTVTLPASSTIGITDTSVTAKTFSGGGLSYGGISITGGGSGTVTFTGANTFSGQLQVVGGTKSIIWPGSTTTTITGGGGFGNGTNIITMTASAGSATLAFGNRINADYLNLTNIPAATTVPAYAGSNSTNGGGNTNWLFLKAPGAQNLLLGVG